jgi:hypothetical protein
MRIDTDELIQHLAENVKATSPLARPWIRTGVWLAISIPYLAAVLAAVLLGRGLSSAPIDARFVLEVISGLCAGITAAMCAFGSVIPGYSRRLIIWLAVPLAVWLGSLGQGCFQEWLREGSAGLSLHHDPSCFPFILFLASFPAVVLTVMLRRGAPLTPRLTAALGGLSAAGLGNFGLRLIVPENADAGLFVWHIGGIFLLSAVAASVGHYLLNWQSITAASQNISR